MGHGELERTERRYLVRAFFIDLLVPLGHSNIFHLTIELHENWAATVTAAIHCTMVCKNLQGACFYISLFMPDKILLPHIRQRGESVGFVCERESRLQTCSVARTHCFLHPRSTLQKSKCCCPNCLAAVLFEWVLQWFPNNRSGDGLSDLWVDELPGNHLQMAEEQPEKLVWNSISKSG